MIGKYNSLNLPISGNLIDYSFEILKNINFRQFTLKDAGVTSRVHNNWKSIGIVPVLEEEGKKLYFNFTQYLWLQIVKDLRVFGLPLETIAFVKDFLFKEDYAADIELSDRDKIELKKDIEKLEQRPITDEELEEYIVLRKEGNAYMPYRFTEIVLEHFVYRSNTYIYIFANGQVAIWSDFHENHNPKMKPDLSEPHINIPLGHYFEQFLSDETKEQFLSKIPILTREETEVLRAMRNDEVKELNIKFSKKGNKRRADLITKVDKQLTDKQKKDIAHILGTRDYSTITMKKQNGTQLTFEEAQRTRL